MSYRKYCLLKVLMSLKSLLLTFRLSYRSHPRSKLRMAPVKQLNLKLYQHWIFLQYRRSPKILGKVSMFRTYISPHDISVTFKNSLSLVMGNSHHSNITHQLMSNTNTSTERWEMDGDKIQTKWRSCWSPLSHIRRRGQFLFNFAKARVRSLWS